MSYWVLGATVVSALISARSAQVQGQTAKQIGRNNQIMAEQAAEDAQKRGEQEAMAARRKGDQILGAQRAAMAASGLDLSVGTAAELQDQTSFFRDQDIRTARMNAAKEAWRARAQGINYRAGSEASADQSNLSALGSLIGGAGKVADRWYTYKGT